MDHTIVGSNKVVVFPKIPALSRWRLEQLGSCLAAGCSGCDVTCRTRNCSFQNILYRIGINLAVCLIFPVYFGSETEEESLFSRVAPYKEQETVYGKPNQAPSLGLHQGAGAVGLGHQTGLFTRLIYSYCWMTPTVHDIATTNVQSVSLVTL